MKSNNLKMWIGFGTTLALLAIVAFNKLLRLDFSGEMTMTLVGLAVTSGAVGAHGAYKTPPGGTP